MHNPDRKFVRPLLKAACLAFVLLAHTGLAQDLEATFLLPPPDSRYGGNGLAIASTLSQEASVEMNVSHSAGPQDFLPLLSSGRAELGLANAQDTYQAFNGEEPYYQQPLEAIRVVAAVDENLIAVAVRDSSNIDSISDLAGMRVSGVFSAHLTCYDFATALLASAGLTWDDVRIVPAAHSADTPELVAQRTIDASLCATPAQSAFQQANARTPLRFLDTDTSEEAMERVHEVMPFVAPKEVEGGTATAVRSDVGMLGIDAYLLSSAEVSEDLVYELTKAMWENKNAIQERSARVVLRVPSSVTAPFHAGAVRYYQEAGMWTQDLQELQEELLSSAGS